MPFRLAAVARFAALLPPLLLVACATSNTICRTDLTLEERQQLMLVPVAVNGTTVPGILDTGAQASAVTPAVVTRLGLLGDPRYEATTGGIGGENVSQSPALVSSFVLAGFDPGSVRYAVISVPLGPPADNPAAAPLGALIGADVLSHFDIDLDVGSHRAVLYDPARCQQKLPDWQGPVVEVPLDVIWSGRLALTVKLDGHDLRALLDTGASRTVLDLPAAEKLGVSREALAQEPGGEGFGAAGVNFRHVEHKFRTLEIGGERYDHPSLSVIDRPLQEADMLLGLDWLRTHRVWISYHQRKLFIALPIG